MTHPLPPCKIDCPTPTWCFENGCVKITEISIERHDQEPNDYVCPEDITCESQETCDIIGLCHKQMVHATKTAWYQRIERLRDIIDDYQIWLFSEDVSDECIVDRWLDCKCEPTVNEKLRMLCAEKWLKYVAERKGTDAARAWFIGNNFDGFPAYVALREDCYYLLEESAKDCTGSIKQ